MVNVLEMKNTKWAIAKCWFKNSESFMNNIMEKLNIIFKPVINPLDKYHQFMYMEWVLYGDGDDIDHFIQYVKDNDYDVEIECL